jgi:hypothetical protein
MYESDTACCDNSGTLNDRQNDPFHPSGLCGPVVLVSFAPRSHQVAFAINPQATK